MERAGKPRRRSQNPRGEGKSAGSDRIKAFGVVDVAATLGAPKRNALINLLRGNVIREVSNLLPEEIDLLVYT